jgi:hypothetical protein
MSTTKIFCHQCGKQTNQIVVAQEQVDFTEDAGYVNGENHIFAKCAGCDAYTYAVENWSEDDWDSFSGVNHSAWKTYPRSESQRKPIEGLDELPAKVKLVYKEVVAAVDAQLHVLAGIGLRALIEAICRDQEITGGNLETLIDGLATSGVLSKAQAEMLHAHRFLGNAAAHQVVSALPSELDAALEIAENILRTIYVLPKLLKQVRTGRRNDDLR